MAVAMWGWQKWSAEATLKVCTCCCMMKNLSAEWKRWHWGSHIYICVRVCVCVCVCVHASMLACAWKKEKDSAWRWKQSGTQMCRTPPHCPRTWLRCKKWWVRVYQCPRQVFSAVTVTLSLLEEDSEHSNRSGSRKKRHHHRAEQSPGTWECNSKEGSRGNKSTQSKCG